MCLNRRLAPKADATLKTRSNVGIMIQSAYSDKKMASRKPISNRPTRWSQINSGRIDRHIRLQPFAIKANQNGRTITRITTTIISTVGTSFMNRKNRSDLALRSSANAFIQPTLMP